MAKLSSSSVDTLVAALALLALLALGIPAAWLAARGLADLWAQPTPSAGLGLSLAAGWHVGWIAAVVRSRRLACVPIAWIVSAETSRRGLLACGFTGSAAVWAIALEATLFGAARQLAPPGAPLTERLERLRRTCDDVSAQLRLAPGVIPWIRTTMRRAVWGGAASAPAFAELAASLRDAETRLAAHFSNAVLPEQVRQSLLTRARDLGAQAELASIETSLALEHQALTAAVAFRDECARLTDLTEDERDAVARRGHAFLLGLVVAGHARGTGSPLAGDSIHDVRH